MSRRTASRAFCGLLLTGLSPLLAQETKLDRDVDFVRKLATELRFTSLAQAEVDRLQAANRDSADFKKIFQLGVEISLIGARSHPNREERRTLFKDALERSKEFIDRYSDEPVANRARRTLVEACYEYGAYLLDEVDIAREEAPEKVKELEDLAESVYKDGIDACEKVMDTTRSGSKQEGSEAQRDYFVTWLFKGMLQRERARANKRDRVPLASAARDTFEELIFEAGEESLLGLRGWFEMSKIGEVLGNYESAFDDYESTIASIKKALEEAGTLGLAVETQEYLFNLLQEAYDRGAEALFQLGKPAETLAFVEQFRADLKQYGEEGADLFDIAHPTYGHPVFLTEARAKAESGDAAKTQEALAMAQRINDAHPSDITGLRAKAVLREILAAQAHFVSGALLFEVAKGDYQEREYERAIQGFKRAYGEMTPEERNKLGFETWTSIARSFALQRRFLEASLAFSKAIDEHNTGVEEVLVNEAGEKLEQTWSAFLRDAKSVDFPIVSQLNDRMAASMASAGGKDSESKLLWKDAEKKLGEDAFADAVAIYARISPDTPYYEPAQARIVTAWQKAGDHTKARGAIAKYLTWTQSAEGTLPSDARGKLESRKGTIAQIKFIDAFMDYMEAVGRVGGAPDPTRFDATITKLRAFITDFGADAPTYVTTAWNLITRLYAELGQIEKAEESYRTLRNLEPNSPLVPQTASVVFKAHYDNVKALETELEALTAKSASDAELKTVDTKLAAARRAAVASGVDYLDNAASPEYAVLYSTMTIAADAADWKSTERFGRRIIELFGKGGEEADKVEKFVTPRLGEALLRQRKFRDAVDILETAAKANPNNYPVKRFLSLAQGGWWEFNSTGGTQEVTGLDEPAVAYRRHWDEYRKYLVARNVEQFTLEWYEFHLECYMFASRAARKDSAFKQTAETLFNIARSVDNFEHLKSLGMAGKRMYDLFMAIR